MGHRLPTMLGKAIGDVFRTQTEQPGEDDIVGLVRCINLMNVLMIELSEVAALRSIIDGSSDPTAIPLSEHADFGILDDEADVALWNK